MRRSIILLTVVAAFFFTNTSGLRCWECSEARDDAHCRRNGTLRECRYNQDACHIELRQHEGWGGHYYIYKHCKQSRACVNNHIQNPRSAWEPSQCNSDDFNSVCRCCCYTDECNVASEDCFGRGGCGLLPTSIDRGSVTCTNTNELGSVCTITCNENAQMHGTQKTYCRYDGTWSQPLASCIEKQCSPRRGLLNGWYICSNGNYAGSQCTTFCRPGYVLVGARLHTCMGLTSRWNFWEPRCKSIRCPDRGTVVGGVVTCSDGRNLQSRCRVECEGYRRLDGISDSYCQDSGTWSHPLPVCIDIQCPLRGSVLNGGVSCSLGVEVTSACQVTCDEGYGPDGSAQSTCLPTGNWDNPLPRCIRLSCPVRGVVKYGVVACSDGAFVGSTCSVVCMDGTRLIGVEVSTCQPTAVWDAPLPTCERIICPERGLISNGVVSCNNGRFVTSVCIGQCNVGYRLSGIRNSVCLATGEWSDPLPTCEVIICPDLDFSLQPGVMTCTNDFFYLSTCSFKCDSGYIIYGAPRISCRRNSLWTTKMPECRRIVCRPRGRIANGVVSCDDGNNIDSVCDASCRPGFSVRGRNPSQCLPNGKWDVPLPTCQPLVCQPRGTVRGGTVSCTNTNFYGSVCTVTCTGGRLLIGVRLSRCTELGWDVALPTCESGPCRDQGTLKHGSITCTNDWNVNSRCTFTCLDEGYELYPAGRSRNVCGPRQLWNVPKPCCTRPCPPWAVMDIVLVLDSSSSIGTENWVLLTGFVERVIRSFIVAPDAANFALFRYNREVDEGTQIFLNSFPGDVEAVVQGLYDIPYDGSGTFTGNALNHAITVSLSEERGNRPDVKNVVLIITDGKAADDVKTPSDELRRMAQILVLGIEPPRGALDLDQLRDMAGSEENLIIAEGGFAGLDKSFGVKLSSTICGRPCQD